MMGRDRYERAPRRTKAQIAESVTMMASAEFGRLPSLEDALARPLNFVAEVNGHQIYRTEDGIRCDLWTPGVGWWGFNLPEDEARRVCKTVCAPKTNREVS